MRKVCTKCDVEKELWEFYNNAYAKSGKQSHCKSCHDLAKAEYHKNNRAKRNSKQREYYYNSEETRKNTNLMNSYGISLYEYKQLVILQGNKCASCFSETVNSKDKYWHVDHCHETNKVRGLLCSNCNLGLGLFSHDISKLQSAIEYLRKSNGS